MTCNRARSSVQGRHFVLVADGRLRGSDKITGQGGGGGVPLPHPLPPYHNFVTSTQSPICHQYKMAPLNVHFENHAASTEHTHYCIPTKRLFNKLLYSQAVVGGSGENVTCLTARFGVQGDGTIDPCEKYCKIKWEAMCLMINSAT